MHIAHSGRLEQGSLMLLPGTSCIHAPTKALTATSMFYAGSYGIGQIFLRQEKYDMALQHFQAASSINTTSSVLRCYCGMALHKMGRLAEALRLLQEAISSDARNPLARYEKASVLTSMDRCQEALREFEALRVRCRLLVMLAVTCLV